MGIFLPLIIAIGALVSIVSLYSTDISSGNLKQILAEKQLVTSYYAALTGLNEALVSPVATNRLNFYWDDGTNPIPPVSPWNPQSGRVYDSSGTNIIAYYRYVALGGDPHYDANGVWDDDRVNALTSIQPRYIGVAATSCMDPNTHQALGAIDMAWDGELTCRVGREVTLYLFAKVSMGSLVSTAMSASNPVEWVRIKVGDDTMTTDGPTIWVPNAGVTNTFEFEDDAWDGGRSQTAGSGLRAADLLKVAVLSGTTPATSTWTEYDALNEHPLLQLPDNTLSPAFDENPTFKLVFHGPLLFKTVFYNEMISADATEGVVLNKCYWNSGTTKCHIFSSTKATAAAPSTSPAAGDVIALSPIPLLPAGMQVLATGALPTPASGNNYVLHIAADSVYDAWGNAVEGQFIEFNVGSSGGGDICTSPDPSDYEDVLITTTGTVWNGTDPNKIYRVTLDGCSSVGCAAYGQWCTLNFGNGVGCNELTISEVNNMDNTVTVTDVGAYATHVTINLPGSSASYNVSGTNPLYYDFTGCSNFRQVEVHGSHTTNYGSDTSCESGGGGHGGGGLGGGGGGGGGLGH
ncbi:MAG: hypothetical protein U0003_01085 [Vampirovibrionales bacterium]